VLSQFAPLELRDLKQRLLLMFLLPYGLTPDALSLCAFVTLCDTFFNVMPKAPIRSRRPFLSATAPCVQHYLMLGETQYVDLCQTPVSLPTDSPLMHCHFASLRLCVTPSSTSRTASPRASHRVI
jgi:hypothetical protein